MDFSSLKFKIFALFIVYIIISVNYILGLLRLLHVNIKALQKEPPQLDHQHPAIQSTIGDKNHTPSKLEVFIRVIELVSDRCHSVQLYFRSVIFRMRITAGHTRVRSVSHG